ncbi:MAG: DUF2254 domain-containing protein [Planctomycetota bacterium]|nr:DUF2254 domain-containing protein [Planctomycetota bacterium]
MKLWLINKWESLQATYWFVPAVMVASAIGLPLAMIHVDRAVSNSDWMATLGWTFTRGPEGSRALLSTVASSMMTIASVSFSITVVALQLASSQFGPRLLRNFMRDRGNQIAIGAFISTFTYCLLVLRTVNGTESEEFVPHISVTVGLVLALVSVGIFIYFIHHSAESIQVENVIVAVSRDLHQAIARLYPKKLGQGPDEKSEAKSRQDLPGNFVSESRAIGSECSNYLQAIDVDRLLELAKKTDLIISVDQRPGKFFVKGDELARAWPENRVDDRIAYEIRGAFLFGTRRTLLQDVEFAIDQLVEVAVRALSPGINDPFTAMNCVDRLGAALCTLAEKAIPSHFRYDDDRRLRVVTDVSTVAGIVDAAFNQIRQAARHDASVTLRLLETIATVCRHTKNPALRAALRHHAAIIYRGSQDGLAEPVDREEVGKRYQDVIEILDNPRADASSTSTPS